jgi:hypothetical protein
LRQATLHGVAGRRRPHPDGGAFAWTEMSAQLRPPDRDASEGSGLASELGMYDDLPGCLNPGEPWVEYGIVERRYRDAHPDAFAQWCNGTAIRAAAPAPRVASRADENAA